MGEHFTHRIINLDTLIQDLRDLGISSGDTVFIKGNLGAVGLPREIDGDIRKVFFEALCKVIGEDGSVMTTAYTSSYLPWNLSKGKVFTDKSPSTQGGAFANFLLNEADILSVPMLLMANMQNISLLITTHLLWPIHHLQS